MVSVRLPPESIIGIAGASNLVLYRWEGQRYKTMSGALCAMKRMNMMSKRLIS
jgi:hypothetical protein